MKLSWHSTMLVVSLLMMLSINSMVKSLRWESWSPPKRSDEPVVSQSDNTTGSNNPTNLKTADAKGFREFNSVEEGIKASADQLFRYFGGEGPAKGKPTKTVKDVINLWRPESDRRGSSDISQANYEKIVADSIGVKSTDSIDINNPQVLGKLIQGITKVEGNEIPLDTIMKSINGVRRDGSYKGAGWLGPIERPDGYVMTEYSIETEIDGKKVLIPSIVPTLTKAEIQELLVMTNEKEFPKDIEKKAIEHAKKRLAEGKSPFID